MARVTKFCVSCFKQNLLFSTGVVALLTLWLMFGYGAQVIFFFTNRNIIPTLALNTVQAKISFILYFLSTHNSGKGSVILVCNKFGL